MRLALPAVWKKHDAGKNVDDQIFTVEMILEADSLVNIGGNDAVQAKAGDYVVTTNANKRKVLSREAVEKLELRE